MAQVSLHNVASIWVPGNPLVLASPDCGCCFPGSACLLFCSLPFLFSLLSLRTQGNQSIHCLSGWTTSERDFVFFLLEAPPPISFCWGWGVSWVAGVLRSKNPPLPSRISCSLPPARPSSTRDWEAGISNFSYFLVTSGGSIQPQSFSCLSCSGSKENDIKILPDT